MSTIEVFKNEGTEIKLAICAGGTREQYAKTVADLTWLLEHHSRVGQFEVIGNPSAKFIFARALSLVKEKQHVGEVAGMVIDALYDSECEIDWKSEATEVSFGVRNTPKAVE